MVWFRRDLRLTDNVSLTKACAGDAPIIPLFVFDEQTPGHWSPGGATRWWLHHSLKALSQDFADGGARMILRRGPAADVIMKLVEETGARAVHMTRMYEPWAKALEKDLKAKLDQQGVALRRFSGNLLHEPETIATQSGAPYKVYTPFWRAILAGNPPRKPHNARRTFKGVEADIETDNIDDWGLLPTKPNWAAGFSEHWQPGEAGARKRLDAFLETAIDGYTADRNRPDKAGTSRLSPHLHFGEISPSYIWYATLQAGRHQPMTDSDRETFLKELAWREFSSHLLFHFPDLPEEPFKPAFAKFPWNDDCEALSAWQRGRTGYPIVDAGMRELWETGWMHNRVRMVVASFLIKHLLIHWREGENWFWDTLVDADLANNAASWQWVAGSGADASPYFRIFNPITQGEKFDPDGTYVRRWVPEIAELPDKVLHAPWTATDDVLKRAGITLGKSYPHPIVDHAEARQRALDGYERVKA